MATTREEGRQFMARQTLNLRISLDNIHCYDEGDGIGNAEPYLWPAFFKIDGDSYAVEAGSGLIGFPTLVSRDGHHGNLGDTDVDAGDNVSVPSGLGLFEGQLKPIPVNDPLIRSLLHADDLPGIAGVAVVLMEEDSWPDSLADTGYHAFVDAVLLAVAKVAAGFQHATHEPTKEEIETAIKTVKDTAADTVEASIKNAMSGWQLLWYGTFGNNDDTIGSEVWIANHDDFAAHGVIPISRHWGSDEAGDGDWEIFGTMTGVVPCPADALSNLFATGERAQAMDDSLEAMRRFRSERFRDLPGLERWWEAVSDNGPAIVQVLERDEAARAAVGRLLAAAPAILEAADQSLAEGHLDDARTVLDTLAREDAGARRSFARRAGAIASEARGQSWNEVVERIASLPPLGRKRPDGLRPRRA